MRQLSLRLIFPCALLVVLSACAKDSAPTNAPANSTNGVAAANANANGAAKPAPKSPLEGIVRASVERVEMRAGETVKANVRLAIADHYHVNANPASEEFLIPTALSVNPAEGITVGKITYPKPVKRKFPYSKGQLDIYEGDALINLTLTAGRDLKPGQRTLSAELRVQPCDDTTCYPPSKISTGIEVTIR
jgi:DsbC/DsbD-like thiol-disulfide interchange protein